MLGLLTWFSNIHCSIESFRFWEEDDYDYQIFAILSFAHAWASVILAGKRDSLRHSTTSFSENVVVAGTSYQILEVWSFCDREGAKRSPMKITALIFQVKIVQWSFPGWTFSDKTRKNFKLNLVLVCHFKCLIKQSYNSHKTCEMLRPWLFKQLTLQPPTL